MSTEIATNGQPQAAAVEQVLLLGDLARLTADQRVSYYSRVCESLALNPLTRPFEFLTLSGKTVLYARRDCTEQLRRRDRVSIAIVGREIVEGVYIVTARATMPDGRADESIGAVSIEGLKGEPRANAIMRGETKAKRRVTLSICGLGMMDESEVDSVPGARVATPPAAKPQPALAERPPADLVDEETVASILALVAELGIDPRRALDQVRQDYGVVYWPELSAAQGGKVLARLEARKALNRQEVPT